MFPTGCEISLEKNNKILQCSVLCRCIQSAEFRESKFGLVSFAKYLLPAASNPTLNVL
jgi:hypothetical protein